MASSDNKDSIPLDELQHYRGVAQEQSTNTILSAQHRAANDADSNPDSTRDSIYDAIAEAKKQISEKDKIPFGGDVKDGQNEEKSVGDVITEKRDEREESASKGAPGTLGDKLSGYAKNIKEAVVGTADVPDDNSNKS